MVKKLEGAGLRGQVAGETSLCTVGQEEGLAYRGHKIETLAEKGTFEEVAYLLLYGKLPNASELSDYKSLLKSLRDLPDSLKKVLREIPASAHPMAVMATGCSMLGNLEPRGVHGCANGFYQSNGCNNAIDCYLLVQIFS